MIFKIINNRKGQGLVEYVMILAFVAIVLIVALTLFGGGINDSYTDTSDQIAGAVGS